MSLIEKLRAETFEGSYETSEGVRLPDVKPHALCQEAADEIERLEKALYDVFITAQNGSDELAMTLNGIAGDALKFHNTKHLEEDQH